MDMDHILADEEIVRRVVAGEPALFELLVTRHNQRVYRTVRSIIRDEAEVDDVMQQAYISAYRHLRQFAGTARFSTWLTRIAINEALARVRRAQRWVAVRDVVASAGGTALAMAGEGPSPEDQVASRELVVLLERSVDSLPEIYRGVFMLREVEGMSTADAAEALGVAEDVVKTRLHRAKALLRDRLASLAEANYGSAFGFEAPRCARLARLVMAAIAGPGGPA
jgi:RNA polymerase sigma-70 factor (ECF subfamily)